MQIYILCEYFVQTLHIKGPNSIDYNFFSRGWILNCKMWFAGRLEGCEMIFSGWDSSPDIVPFLSQWTPNYDVCTVRGRKGGIVNFTTYTSCQFPPCVCRKHAPISGCEGLSEHNKKNSPNVCASFTKHWKPRAMLNLIISLSLTVSSRRDGTSTKRCQEAFRNLARDQLVNRIFKSTFTWWTLSFITHQHNAPI